MLTDFLKLLFEKLKKLLYLILQESIKDLFISKLSLLIFLVELFNAILIISYGLLSGYLYQ